MDLSDQSTFFPAPMKSKQGEKSAVWKSGKAADLEEPTQANAENGAWQGVHGVWRRIYGSFPEEARSVEWHDFAIDHPLDWASSFHEGSLEICLNFGGTGRFGPEKTGQEVSSGMVSLHNTSVSKLAAERLPDKMHRFFTLELGAEYLSKELRFVMDGLLPEVRKFCDGGGKQSPFLRVDPMPVQLLALRMWLLNPPVNPGAYPLWYESKLAEILSHFLFQPESPSELFCHKHNRLNRERCERVLFLLERDMENPPTLEMLAAEVGCSPFYLSRIFVQETGGTITSTLRKFRIQKAAELLRESSLSVTDIAMQVGYASLGAFNKAFAEQFGVSPGAYAKKGSP